MRTRLFTALPMLILALSFRPPVNGLSIDGTLRSKSGKVQAGTVCLKDGKRILSSARVPENGHFMLETNLRETHDSVSLSFATEADTVLLERFIRFPAQVLTRVYDIR